MVDLEHVRMASKTMLALGSPTYAEIVAQAADVVERQ